MRCFGWLAVLGLLVGCSLGGVDAGYVAPGGGTDAGADADVEVDGRDAQP